MTYRIIKAPVEVTPYIEQVRDLGDANRSTLGFLRSSVYMEAAMKGRLWIAADRRKRDLTGYLLFGGAYPHLKVVQVFVHPEFRSFGVARTLIEELKSQGEETNHLTLTARVATELPANRFWQRLGFRVVQQVPGGKTSGRTINIYLLELDAPSLFREYHDDASSSVEDVQEIFYPSRPILQTPSYVIDLNIFFDVVRNRDTGESARILSSAFNSEIKLHVTSEFVRELERHSQDLENDPVLEFAKGLPALPELSPDTLKPLTETIRKILSPHATRIGRERPNDVSDLIHLASCIHHRAYGFVTRDTTILQRASDLHERYSLRVISPSDLYDSHEEVDARPPRLTVAIGQQEISVSELHESDRPEAEAFLVGLGIESSNALSCLASGTTHFPRVRLVARVENELVGIASWSASHGIVQDSMVYLYINEDHPTSYNAIGCLLESSITFGSYGQLRRLDLEIGPSQIKTREIAISRGFRPLTLHGGDTPRALTKISLKGIVTNYNWSSFKGEFGTATGFELPLGMPRHEELVNTGVFLNRKTDGRRFAISLFDFETLISPGALICTGRPAVMIPIRPEYADELLPSTVRQLSALPGKEAALRLEKAYFSGAGRHGLLRPGKISVFYISRRRKEAVAAARITFSGSLTKTQAVLNLGRQGVLTEDEIHQTTNQKGEVTAFTFDNLISFPTCIPYRELKEMGCIGKTNLVTAEALSHDSLCRIIERAFEGNL